MPKNNGLQLFTKTWPLKRDKKIKEEECKRPLTATLEKPTILDIRFIGKIDMSRVRKEFLNISNLCRMPLVIKEKKDKKQPLSLLSTEMHRKSKKKRKKTDTNDDSHEDDESSVVQSAKINTSKNVRSKSRSSGRLSNNNSLIHQLKHNSVLAIKNIVNDANNNKTLKIPSRKPILTTIPTPIVPITGPDPEKTSTKLPSPCRTCGRPDLPERFHSHPAIPLKTSCRNKGVISSVVLDKTEKIPVKSTVQKPVAIKYKSKNGSAEARKKSPLKKYSNQISSLPIPVVKKSGTLNTTRNKESIVNSNESTVSAPSADSDRESTMIGQSVTPPRGGSGKRTLTCYICGREFGTASLPLHEPKCLEKWERENACFPPNMRRKAPVKPEGAISQKEWNQLAWESSQSALVPCNNCGRTFYPDRLVVHQKSCKIQNNNNINRKTSSIDTLNLSSFSPMSQSSDPPSTSTSAKGHKPPSVQCYICGRMFGTHSIKIHEKKCLEKWHAENESLPPDMRSPAPTRQDKIQNRSPLSPPSSSSTPSPKNNKDERPASGVKSPLFPCYLCGKLFTVNSIYIHEPQCLKMWKIENDKLPPNKRRPVPLKPDIKFTGELNVVYFFVRLRFEWDAIEYSLFSTFQFVTNTLGTIFSLALFTKFLRFDDSILGIISCSTKIMSSFVYAFAPTPFYFYLGALVELLNGTSFIAMRAMITKLVLPEELGKINSLFGVGEAIVPLIYGPLYSRIYAKTIDTFPGGFYLAGGALTVPALFIFYWLYLEHKKDLREVEILKSQEQKLLENKGLNVTQENKATNVLNAS